MYQTLLFIKYFPFFKGNRFKTAILALILISGNICLAQDLYNNNFKLKEKSHQSFLLNNKGFGEEYKESKNRTTFFAGAGPIMSFHPGSYGRNYISVWGGLGVNFKLSNKFYLNLETGMFKQSNETGIWLSLSPEFRLSFQNMEVFWGLGES